MNKRYIDIFREIIIKKDKYSFEINQDWISYHLIRNKWVSDKFIKIFGVKREYNAHIDIFDPWVDSESVKKVYSLDIADESFLKNKYDAIVFAVAHNKFLKIDLEKISHKNTIIFDIKSFLPKNNKLNIYQL